MAMIAGRIMRMIALNFALNDEPKASSVDAPCKEPAVTVNHKAA